MEKEYINNEIMKNYLTEDTKKLAKRLGLTEVNLRKKASRLGLKKGTVTNSVINGKKLCSCCGKMLDISNFNKDKYQPNGLDYNCKKCRLKGNKKTVTKSVLKNNSMAFNKRKTTNPVVLVNGIQSLKCKSCNEVKALTEFHKDKNNVSGHKNFCKICVSKKKRSV